jgi:hypothetical protein
MDPDQDHAFFVIDLQDANKKLYFLKSLSAYGVLISVVPVRYIYIIFQR